MSDAKVRRYANTVLEFNDDGAPRAIDLRRPMGAEEHKLLTDLRLQAPFAVITAFNPHGQDGSPGNPERQNELEMLLREEGVPFVRLDGCSPDLSHREASVAVHVSEERAREIAIRFGQDAIFSYDGETFYLVGALEPLGRVSLPLSHGG